MARKVRRRHEDVAVEEEQPIWQRPIIWVALLGGILLAVLLIFVAGSQDGTTANTGSGTVWDTVPTDGRAAGPADAPVHIVEYSDYACPHCRNFHEETLVPLTETYVADGTVRLEMQPVAYLGEESGRAAEAALCAQDQGAFWPYHDTLFDAQGRFGRSAFTNARLKEYAGQLGLDQSEFGTCLDGGTHRTDVLEITNEARARGVSGTPTTFVNGTIVNGAVPYDQFVNQYLSQYVQ